MNKMYYRISDTFLLPESHQVNVGDENVLYGFHIHFYCTEGRLRKFFSVTCGITKESSLKINDILPNLVKDSKEMLCAEIMKSELYKESGGNP